jgi:methylated-DNA-[protein]-cysteine S-methyltransferase
MGVALLPVTASLPSLLSLWSHPNLRGVLKLEHNGQKLLSVSYQKQDERCQDSPLPSFLRPLVEWLDGYAEHPCEMCPIDWETFPRERGTPFQEKIWMALNQIPAGQTLSYQELALRAGYSERSARPVGGAVARNPFIILIPCHRVLRHSGELGGYSGDGGIERKKELLRHEGALGRS